MEDAKLLITQFYHGLNWGLVVLCCRFCSWFFIFGFSYDASCVLLCTICMPIQKYCLNSEVLRQFKILSIMCMYIHCVYKYILNESSLISRWQQLLINRFVGYDTILINSLLNTPGQGKQNSLQVTFLKFSFVDLVGDLMPCWLLFRNERPKAFNCDFFVASLSLSLSLSEGVLIHFFCINS